MISKTMQDALNAQINAEQASIQLYLAMSAHCDGLSFKGFAKWLRVQAAEETVHAMKLIDFLLDRNGKLELKAIGAPPTDFGGVIQVFERTLAHEKGITSKINSLFELARSEKDFASEITLQWYVTEQVEEEANATEIVAKLKMVGDKSPGGLFYIDKALGKRGAE